jgi:DNA repair exonuclease SbcCD nuclease subunit
MNILLTGDFHVKKGINTNIILDYLDYLKAYCKENAIFDIIIMGDIFDKSSNIKNEAFVPLFMKFYDMKKDGIDFTFILGNHDIYSVNNDSIVETFKPIGRVIKEAEYLGGPQDFSYLPYTKKEDDIVPQDGYLFTHIPIADFSFDNAYHATEKHAFKRDLFSDFNLVFTGHFHRHQSKDNIVYVGSPTQLNFGEMGQKKGFVVFNDTNGSWKFVEYTQAPKFIKIDINDFQDFDPQNKFVGIKIDRKIENFVKLRKVLFEKGALEVVPFFEKKEDVEVKKIDHVEDNSSIENIVRNFLHGVKEEGVSNDKLLEIFEEVLNETS